MESSESDTHSTEKKRQRTGSPIETEQEIHKQDQEPQKTEQQASTPPLNDSRQSDSYSNENGGKYMFSPFLFITKPYFK